MKRLPFFLSLLTVVMLAIAVWQPQVRADNPPATRLAVVNIMKVFQSLDERRTSEEEIVKMSDDLNKQKQDMQKIVDDDENTLKDLTPESQGYRDASEKLLKDTMELKAQMGLMEAKLTMEQRLRTMKIYRHINDTIADYSKEKGIALVLVAEDPDLSGARDMDALLSKIATRKVLYSDSSLDITKDLITRMNTAFATSPKVGP